MADPERLAAREAEGLPQTLEEMTSEQIKKVLGQNIDEVDQGASSEVDAPAIASEGEGST